MLSNITTEDLLGRNFIRLKGSQNKFRSYFKGVKRLQSFLRSDKLKDYITGYYLSAWFDSLNGIRFSYFTKKPNAAPKFLRDSFSNLGFIKCDEEKPKENIFNHYYGADNYKEIYFRRFLHLITLIGLDLLYYNIEYARRVVAGYRMRIGPEKSAKDYFKPAFKKSNFYLSLRKKYKKELWKGLEYWYAPGKPKGDWAHMLVVMLLPGDIGFLPYKNKKLQENFIKFLNERWQVDLEKGWNP